MESLYFGDDTQELSFQNSNYLRPSGLCNTLYKCVTKCVLKRLSLLFLSSIITDYQHVFVSNRLMSENIMITLIQGFKIILKTFYL